jgi:urease alpha subunit
MKNVIKLVVGLAVAALLAGEPALAYDWGVAAHVTLIEPTNMPTALVFQIDTAAGRTVEVYGMNTDCTVTFIHIK